MTVEPIERTHTRRSDPPGYIPFALLAGGVVTVVGVIALSLWFLVVG